MTSKQKEILKPYIDFKDHCIHRGLPFQTSEINLMSKFEVGLLNYFDEQNKNLTLLECIKEWNENGFDVDIYALEIVIANYSTAKCEADEVEFSIDLLSKQVSIPNGCWAKLPFKIYHLLSKTLKALEEIKDECN